MIMLDGKVAIVTGGSRGIGAATSRLLASRGATVVINYVRNQEAAEALATEIEAAGGLAVAIQGDVTQQADVQRLVDSTLERFGRIDILVSNASISFAIRPFAQLSWEEFAHKLDGELGAAFAMTQAVLPVMQEQQYGRIIYVSSGLSQSTVPGFIAHGSAKAALNTFCQYIAQEVGPFGITANVVSPGLTETDATAGQPAAMKAQIAAMTPLRRIAVPDDIAGAIAFLASDDSKYVTGAYLPVNGGSR